MDGHIHDRRGAAYTAEYGVGKGADKAGGPRMHRGMRPQPNRSRTRLVVVPRIHSLRSALMDKVAPRNFTPAYRPTRRLPHAEVIPTASPTEGEPAVPASPSPHPPEERLDCDVYVVLGRPVLRKGLARHNGA